MSGGDGNVSGDERFRTMCLSVDCASNTRCPPLWRVGWEREARLERGMVLPVSVNPKLSEPVAGAGR